MNQADRDLLREVSGFLAEHYRGPGVDEMRRRIDQRLNSDDLDGRFARLREREAVGETETYTELTGRGDE